ncbi:DUF4276 family protein [Lentzea sp.]|uniref:DUF4276 family protein n=1 Tax=Lentzea sp. TaxID=56099 RepID=UPI002BF750E7|nr:DUF4276 family protein [Lentzea sp.]HUQ56784.1 DUF4276 family protein [Lentzea sp.]
MSHVCRSLHLLVEGQTEEAVVNTVLKPYPESLGWWVSDRLTADEQAAGGPELVNDGPTTAPSKRILRYCPGYMKTSDGPIAIEDLGVTALRARCPHLDDWLRSLE